MSSLSERLGLTRESEPSGRFEVRLPKSLHARLLQEVDKEGVSLNQAITLILARCLNWSEQPAANPATADSTTRHNAYGGNRPSYRVRERPDGWLEIEVLHQNRSFRAVLADHKKGDGHYFLEHLSTFRRAHLQAQLHLSHLIQEWEPFFLANKVEFVLDDDKTGLQMGE